MFIFKNERVEVKFYTRTIFSQNWTRKFLIRIMVHSIFRTTIKGISITEMVGRLNTITALAVLAGS